MDKLPEIEHLLLWATGLSLLTLALTLVAVPWAIARLPSDYFVRDRRPGPEAHLPSRDRTGLGRLVLVACKNVVGALLALLGLAMLFTPGQGLLTLLVGLLLMNFPGKYRLERALVSRPGVLRALNWLRQKQGYRAFVSPLSTKHRDDRS